MNLCSAEEVIQAKFPQDIFSMDKSTIEEEKEQYLNIFKPSPYNTVKHFLAAQRVVLLYEQALSYLDSGYVSNNFREIVDFFSVTGEHIQFHNVKINDFELGKMYITEKSIGYLIESKYKKYYDNYLKKTATYSKPDKKIWDTVSYMLPNVVKNFECKNVPGYLIIISKSPAMYPLRDILQFYNGSMTPEHVASIVTRLMYFVCYLDLTEISHNGITLNNIFFSPGKMIEHKSLTECSDDERRVTGIYGGWFFSTWRNEKIMGMPQAVKSNCEAEVKYGYSSFKVDVLSVKSLAKTLLGDNLLDLAEPFKKWLNQTNVYGSAYDEFKNWDKALLETFGSHKFVPMNISINN